MAKSLVSAMYMDADLDLIGSIALVSHHGPVGSKSGYWFDDFKLEGKGVEYNEENLFGPVLCTLYTISDQKFKTDCAAPPS